MLEQAKKPLKSWVLRLFTLIFTHSIRRRPRIQESKNGKPRTLPLNQIALDILMEKSKIMNIRHDFVFTSKVGTKIDSDNRRRAFESVLEKTDIQDFHLHDLRHTFASRLAQKGLDIYTISKLLGHKDIRMTQRYAHHCPESLRVGIQLLEAGHNSVTIGETLSVLNSWKPLNLLVELRGFEPLTFWMPFVNWAFLTFFITDLYCDCYDRN